MELTSVFLYLLIALVTLAVYYIHHRQTYWKRRSIPHDEPNLLHGNMQGLKTKYHQQDIFQRFYQKYKGSGPFCGFYFFQMPVAFITDLQLVKNVLIKDFANFRDRPTFYNEKDDPLSAHLFSLDGKKWKLLRHKLSPTFTSGKMKFMFPTIVQVAHEFTTVMNGMLSEGSTVEVKELFARFTTDVIGTCAFGIECNSLKDPNAKFREMGRRTFSERRHSQVMLGLAQSYPKIAKWLGFCVFPDDVTAFFLQAVRNTVALREEQNIKRNDFMDMLIDIKNNGVADEQLSIEEIAAQAFVFFLAGFETSSTTGSFALYELAQHQDVQDRVRQEINEVLERHNDEFTYESMKEMQYLDQIISETLRLYTVVPALVRVCQADYPVPGHPEYVIEKGTTALIPATAIHRDAELYPNPNLFNPDHFAPDRVQGRESVAFLPFGEGPRNCIGMRFGQMQSRIGLAMLLQRFKFSTVPETQIPIKIDKANSLCGSAGGIYLKAEKI